MRKSHALAAVLALGSLAALPACSMMSGHSSGGGSAMARPSQVSPGMVKQVQADLQQQGIYKGNVDGMWGPETQSAVANFQQAHGMPATGELNSPTLAALNLPSDGTTAATGAAPMAPAQMTPAPMTAPPATTSSATTPMAPAATSSTQ